MRGFLSFALFLSSLLATASLRTLTSWNEIFRSHSGPLRSPMGLEEEDITRFSSSSSSSHLRTDDWSKPSFSLEPHHNSYLSSLGLHQKTSFILEYPEDCTSQCHDLVRDLFLKNGDQVYHILTSKHGLIFSDYQTISKIASNISTIISDYVPLLPDLKIDANVDLDMNCNSSSEIIALNILIVPLPEESLQSFIQDIIQSSSSPSSQSQEVSSFIIKQQDLQFIKPNQENILSVSLNCSNFKKYLNYFSRFHEVFWIEKSYEMRTSLKWANGVAQSGKHNKLPLYEANLTGRGQIIGIADTGLDINSCFFHDPEVAMPFDKTNFSHRKVIQYVTHQDGEDGSGHGTSVSGAAAGKCLISNKNSYFQNSQYQGAAYDAKISFFDIGRGRSLSVSPPTNYYSGLFLVLYSSGARVMSMSWGSTSNGYTAQARFIDQFMWDYPDTLIIYAAGNSGESGFNTVGSPATNKNGIAACASMNDEQSWNAQGKVSTKETSLSKHGLAQFSSKGPTSDGRLKPEICSIGYFVSTAGAEVRDDNNQNCGVVIQQGTSFSAPILAGYAAIVRQYFMDGWYPSGFLHPNDGFTPSGALMKAILVHGGQPLQYISDGASSTKTSWGDDHQGYGRTQLDTVLSFLRNSTLNGLTFFVKGAVDPKSPHYAELTRGESHQYQFTARNVKNLSPIRITLAYTDFYGSIGATHALINDLDIQLSNSTHTFYPVITNDGFGRADRKNNLECIVLHYPRPNGNYTVTVTARSISRTQPYALVITGQIGRFPVSSFEDIYDSGLTPLARLLVIIACGVTCCFVPFVFWIGFANPQRRKRIKEQRQWATSY